MGAKGIFDFGDGFGAAAVFGEDGDAGCGRGLLRVGCGGDADDYCGDDEAEDGECGELRGGILIWGEQAFDAHGEDSSVGS